MFLKSVHLLLCRVYIEKDDIRSVRLYITRIAEGDAGLYTCEDDSTGSDEYADVKLFIYGM